MARPNVIIDALGTVWDPRSFEFRRHLHLEDTGEDAVAFSIRYLGYASVEARHRATIVTLNPRLISKNARLRLAMCVRQRGHDRVLVQDIDDGTNVPRLYASQRDAMTGLLSLISSVQAECQQRFRFLRQRPSRSEPLKEAVKLWERERAGTRLDQVLKELQQFDLRRYSVVTRGTAQNIPEYLFISPFLELPCPTWNVAMIGRPVPHLPDGEYGQWVAGAHTAALTSGEMRDELIEAEIRVPLGPAKRHKYRRLILPVQSAAAARALVVISSSP